MALPRMTSVFLVEASMHAWKNLGYTPETKEYIESHAPEHPYELAIIMAAMADDKSRINDPKRNQIILGHVIAEYLPRIKQHAKIRADMRREAAKLVSSRGPDGFVDGLEQILNIFARYPQREPEGYAGEPFADAGGGWGWVRLDYSSCRDYEGQLMQHCGSSHGTMISLRDPQGKPHATAEVNFDPSRIDVMQLKGKQNAPLAKTYWPKLKPLFKVLAGGLAPVIFADELYFQPRTAERGFNDFSWRDEAVEFLDFLKTTDADEVLDIALGKTIRLNDPELKQKLLRVPYERTPEDGPPPDEEAFFAELGARGEGGPRPGDPPEQFVDGDGPFGPNF